MPDESNQPNWKETYAQMPIYFRVIAPLEFIARWIFFLLKASAFLRLTIEVAAGVAIILGLYGLYKEFDAREEERIARMWNIATDPRPGSSGKVPALEYLNSRNEKFVGIQIPSAYLEGVNLEKASLVEANLSAAILSSANFSGADFSGSDLRKALLLCSNLDGATFDRKTKVKGAFFNHSSLREASFNTVQLKRMNFFRVDARDATFRNSVLDFADFVDADLRDVDFSGAELFETHLDNANISGANLESAKHLSQVQLNKACGLRPPKLPNKFFWKKRECRSLLPRMAEECRPYSPFAE